MKSMQMSDTQVVDAIASGQVGVLPTDTIYGVVAAAGNPEAVARLYDLKHRNHKPGTIIAANAEQLVELGIPKRYLIAVEQFWPGPVSVEIPHDITYLNQDTGRQAFRVVSDKKVSSLLSKTGPLVTSSANEPGQPPATTVKEAHDYFGDEVDFYVDGGDLSDHKPSTIIRIVDDAVEVVRPGAVTIDEASGQIVS